MIALFATLLAVVTAPYAPVSYACDGSTAAFTVNFPYQSQGDLAVTTVTGPGVSTSLTISLDYVLNVSSTQSTATLTLTLPAVTCPVGNTLKIARSTALTQPTGFRQQTVFNPSTHETALDRLEMQTQESSVSIATHTASIATNATNLATETANRISADTATNSLLATDLAAMTAGGAPGVAASNSTVIPTGATSSNTLKDLVQMRGLNVADFLPVGYVTDGTVDYTAQFNAAITAAQAAIFTRWLVVPKGIFKVTGNLSIVNVNIVGMGPQDTEIDCFSAGVCLTFSTTRGNILSGIRFVSKAAGQSGVLVLGAYAHLRHLKIEEFDTADLQLGTASVTGCYYADVVNVQIVNSVTQGVNGVLIAGGFPSSNDDRFTQTTVSGKLTRMVQFDGTKNIWMQGDVDPDTRGTGVAAVFYITGSMNEVRGSYTELVTGSAQPTTVVTYTSTTNSNSVSDLQMQYAPQNMSLAFSDAGWNNRVDVRAVGFNLLTVGNNSSDQNLVVNSGFQQWDTVAVAPYGWVNLGGAGTAAQDTVTVHGTATSLKLTGAAQNVLWASFFVSPSAGNKSLNQYPIAYFRGKQVTCRVWCKSSFAGQGNLRVTMDGTGGASFGQSSHSGSGNWEELTASGLIPADATQVGLHLRNTNGGGTLTGDIWFSEPECTVGTYVGHYAAHPLTDTTAQLMGPLVLAPPVTLTYGASLATDASLGNTFVVTATNATAFVFANPTNLKKGQKISYTVRNTSGGALGAITWGATFKTAAFTAPATANSRSTEFYYDGTNLIQLYQSAADVPN